jgi:hypothetical protein
MKEFLIEVIKESIIDSIKLLPFLFITYLIMEYIEHKASTKFSKVVGKSGKTGPLVGAILGVVPQCGFSVSATNLYAGRIITLGTLIAVYLSTSDEMLPVLISNKVGISAILIILGIKLAIGIIAGVIIDFVISIKNKNEKGTGVVEICEHEHCHCDEEGILKSSLKHTLQIFMYIFIFTVILNGIIEWIGQDAISSFISNKPVLGPVISALIGLIPNCAGSVILTELYIAKVITMSTMIAGVLVNAGVALLVLFRINKDIRENIRIVLLLYAIGAGAGIILELFNI